MRDHIKARAIKVAQFVIETKVTIRQAATHFKVARCTAHLDLTSRISAIDPEMATQVRRILSYNDSVKHIRGGEATRRMWQGKVTKKWKAAVDKEFADYMFK
ncbi:Stage III sporulation protein D [compost metagenome]